MTPLQSLLFFAVSFGASVVGAVCGIGGGVVIKPALDLFGWESVATISFLSGCTVLSMSCYSVGRSLLSGEKTIDPRTGTPLALGAALGGVAGKQLFTYVKALFPDPNRVGAVQALCLALITLGTLVYTVQKARIRPRRAEGTPARVAIGLVLGICSSFLGIGGGPINLVVLHFFFDMDAKTAAANSLYVILFSQAASLLATLLTHTVPPFAPLTLALMVCGGLLGGMAGRRVNQRMDNAAVDRLFILLMAAIIGICAYNVFQYAAY